MIRRFLSRISRFVCQYPELFVYAAVFALVAWWVLHIPVIRFLLSPVSGILVALAGIYGANQGYTAALSRRMSKPNDRFGGYAK